MKARNWLIGDSHIGMVWCWSCGFPLGPQAKAVHIPLTAYPLPQRCGPLPQATALAVSFIDPNRKSHFQYAGSPNWAISCGFQTLSTRRSVREQNRK
jgi:hypothetical protein